jgi:hypothetical protein
MARRYAVAALALMVLFTGVMPAWGGHIVPNSIRRKFHFRYNLTSYHSEFAQWMMQRNRAKEWEIDGRTLKAYAAPSDSIVCGYIGAIGYFSGLYIYDLNGLIDRGVASREIATPLHSAGHDKRVEIEYFLDEDPTFIYMLLVPGSRLKGFMERDSGTEGTGWVPLVEDFPIDISLIKDKYVPDFLPVEGVASEGGPFYLFVVRRIENGTLPAEAWRRAREALEGF